VKADLTRKSLNLLKHFSQVLNQQGRVQLDADWNEEGGILLHLIRQLTADQLGPAATSPRNGGFTIVPLTLGANANPIANDIGIMPGTYYVDGILCELDATPVPITSVNASSNGVTVANWTVDAVPFAVNQYVRLWNDATYPGTTPPPQTPASPMAELTVSQVTQPNYASLGLTLNMLPGGFTTSSSNWGFVQRIGSYLTQPDLPPIPPALNPPALASGSNLIYLDVWERLITCIEDDSIREVALNGPDTGARARVVWQVKARPGSACISSAQLTETLQPWTRGYLRARVSPAQVSTDPCTISPNSQYRGAENQLYRVEIHTGTIDVNGNATGGTPSFKWSRENGAVVFPVVNVATSSNSTTVILGNLGRDERFGLEVGDYVELQDDMSVLNNITGNLLQVQSIDTGSFTVMLAGTTTPNVGTNAALHPLLRRWDQQSGDPTQGGEEVLPDGALPIPTTTAQWVDLEDGVQVRFEVLANVTFSFRSGDYWLIPARVATGNVIWPTEMVTDTQGKSVTNPVAMPPDGITHHYAPLAVATIGTGPPSITPCPVP
jgi:hypothetical protein